MNDDFREMIKENLSSIVNRNELGSCPSCKKKISILALSCPNCGRPKPFLIVGVQEHGEKCKKCNGEGEGVFPEYKNYKYSAEYKTCEQCNGHGKLYTYTLDWTEN